MNINEPIRLDSSILFCEIGNRLGLEVLDAVRYAVCTQDANLIPRFGERLSLPFSMTSIRIPPTASIAATNGNIQARDPEWFRKSTIAAGRVMNAPGASRTCT
jgi:hypothetical protein